jgi:ABC-type bacteriocin/lantibiotic exporter with double-glycine peptidase domain
MTETNSQSKKNNLPKKVGPFQCLASSAIASGLAVAMYSLMHSIAETFAKKPIVSDNPFVINISSLVRSLVVAIAALATCMCAIVAIGLIALAIQLIVQRFTNKVTPPAS